MRREWPEATHQRSRGRGWRLDEVQRGAADALQPREITFPLGIGANGAGVGAAMPLTHAGERDTNQLTTTTRVHHSGPPRPINVCDIGRVRLAMDKAQSTW